jgi:ribosomal protein L37AE/L43A
MSEHKPVAEGKQPDPKKYLCPKCKKWAVQAANCGCATCAACGYRDPCN